MYKFIYLKSTTERLSNVHKNTELYTTKKLDHKTELTYDSI